uniref:Uncharacterized protein n=1 Tax=Rhizophora mucronata TaxID=61149 RepID=A0A2P2ILB5_RHIMU
MDGRRLGRLSFWKFIHMMALWLLHASLKGLQLQKVVKGEVLV